MKWLSRLEKGNWSTLGPLYQVDDRVAEMQLYAVVTQKTLNVSLFAYPKF